MLEGPCRGNIRHLTLSKRDLAQAEVLTMDQALLSQEWRQYFAEYGPVIFNALKSDKCPQRKKREMPLAWLLRSRGKKSSHALIRSGSVARFDSGSSTDA